jgi:hypothetical protein
MGWAPYVVDPAAIDNVLVGPGRRSFTGPRRVLAAMSN